MMLHAEYDDFGEYVEAVSDGELAVVDPDELKRIVERKKLILGFDHGKLIGFIGEHLEGSMGLLYVFPEQVPDSIVIDQKPIGTSIEGQSGRR